MIYLFLISLPFFFHLIENYKIKFKKHFLWRICFLIMLFFLAFRYQIGGDLYQYLGNYQNFNFDFKLDINNFNLFIIIQSIYKKLNLSIIWYNFFLTSIYLISLFYFCSQFKFKWIALLSTMPYLTTIVATGYLKQTLAISFLMLFFVAAYKKYKYSKITFLILSIFSHPSSIIFTFFNINKKNLPIVFLLILIFGITFFSDLVIIFENYIINYEKNSAGFLYRLINISFFLLPCFYLFFYEKLCDIEKYIIFFSSIILLISIFIYILYPNLSTILDRFNLYQFIFLPIYTSLIFENKSNIPIIKYINNGLLLTLFYFYNLSYFLIWAYYGDAYSYWKYYDNIFFYWI